MRHNDISVLENHHIAAAFALMNAEEQNNWMHKFKTDDFKRMRKLMIDVVFATDMSKHFGEVGQFKSLIANGDFKPNQGTDKQLLIKMIFHMSDISNPTKDFKLCRLWTDLLFVEFFAQGDLEKQHGFPVSLFYDRETTNIAKS